MISMNLTKLAKKRKTNVRVKKYDLRDLLEYVEKNMEPHPRLNVVKWMEKHGR